MTQQLSAADRDRLAPLPGIGMTDSEIRNYSLTRAIQSLSSPERRQRDGLEFEASRETVKRILGKDPDLYHSHRLAIPPDILQRDLNVASAGAGGYLVQQSNVGFAETLYNRMVVLQMGATRIPGLRDDIAVPKTTANATAEWLTSESDSPSESQPTLGQVAMTPRTASAYTELSRQLLLQSSPAVDSMIERHLASIVAIAGDAAAINGSGASGEPEGILQVTGIGSVTGTSIAYDDILEFQSDVLTGNALLDIQRSGYVATSAVASILMQRVKFSSTASPIWEGAMSDGDVVGFKAMASEQIPTAILIFGDWSQLALAEWGVLEVEANPFANFAAGITGVRAMYSMDVGVLHPAAFSVATSIT